MSEIDPRLRRLLVALRWTVVLCALIGSVIVVVEVVVGNRFSEEDIERMVRQTGATGPIAFVVFFALTGSLLIPTTVLAVVGATLFGRLPGFAFSMAGAFLAAMIGFTAARTLGREFVSRWLGKRAGALARLDERLEKRGFMTALVMRLLYIPNGLINLACGVSGMRATHYALATLCGLTPMVFAVVFVTDGAKAAILDGDWSALLEPETIAAMVLFFVCIATPLTTGLVRRRVRARELLSQPFDAIGDVLEDFDA